MSGAPVVIAAGGTGGHVVPALAVADVLAARDVPVVWVGTRAGLESRLVPAAGIDIRWIDVAGLRGQGVLGTLIGPLRLGRAIVQSVRLLRELRPRAVLGMGGFVSGPVGLAALGLRLPLVLHEQNALAGMTNRRLARFATRVFSAWPGVFPDDVSARAVGNPVRRDMAVLAARTRGDAGSRANPGSAAADPARGAIASSATPLHVLVVGGSRGARVLNETVPSAIARLDAPVAVRHQTGSADLDAVRARYADASRDAAADVATAGRADVVVEAFIDDMASAYARADIVVCRSGAMTVTELAALGVPSILVPFPQAVDDHQSANARRLSTIGGAVLMPQSTFTAASLAAELSRLSADREALARMAATAREDYRAGAAEAVADALMQVDATNDGVVAEVAR